MLAAWRVREGTLEAWPGFFTTIVARERQGLKRQRARSADRRRHTLRYVNKLLKAPQEASDADNEYFRRTEKRLTDMGRKTGRRAFDQLRGEASTIGIGTTFEGRFSGKDNCIVYGRVVGDCRLEGCLIISDKAHWSGNIEADNVLVAGQVQGEVIARAQLELLETARIVGRLSAPSIAIAEGAVHEGEVCMADSTKLIHFSEKRKNAPQVETCEVASPVDAGE